MSEDEYPEQSTVYPNEYIHLFFSMCYYQRIGYKFSDNIADWSRLLTQRILPILVCEMQTPNAVQMGFAGTSDFSHIFLFTLKVMTVNKKLRSWLSTSREPVKN